MWRGILVALALGGCTSLQTQFNDMQARRLDIGSGSSAIYVIREAPDTNAHATVVMLDGKSESLTYPGTFVRWEVTPGSHRITGFGGDRGSIEVHAAPGKIYFIRQTVALVEQMPQSNFRTVNEEYARAAIERVRRVSAS